ncbi:hypothetical protein [Oceanomicrobium pacificus]|uniref:Uncharacterized protein n=1 Tax=Oceanomicrobium pacificus TaxID=2692916 RepID=A0A6B0TR12_9RHOB|nr:hypothetical protein [Oceanomicrobium pacificus]MXU64188.1 hypothetical protein [Oceanomicrobium pacificus]
MAFEALKVQIMMLMEQMTHQPEDAHEIQESLREKLAEIKALGMPLPEDLVELEEALEQDLNLPKR